MALVKTQDVGSWLRQVYATSSKVSATNGRADNHKLSFQAKNRHAFWETLHPRKSSGGCWIPFEGPEQLRGICDARWIQQIKDKGGFYSRNHVCNGKQWTEWLWDSEIVFCQSTA